MSRKGKILADNANRFLRGSFYISGILKQGGGNVMF